MNGGDWVTAADQGYPPLIHWVAAPLGSVLGHHVGIVERAGLLWLLLLVAATGVLATAVTEDRTTGALAAATVATFPALHGTALGYFHDLPMTALLFAAAAALFAYGTTRPVVAGTSAGVFFVLACTGKWTALVLAPFLVLPALLNNGFGIAPASGHILSRLILEQTPDLPIGSFAFNRFDQKSTPQSQATLHG